MELFQSVAQRVGDALRQENWNSSANPQELDMRNRPQTAKQMVELFIAKKQRIPAAEQDVTNRRSAPDVIYLPVEFRVKVVSGRITNQARARAIPAISGAAVGDQEQHTIRIAVHQPRHRRVRIFATRVQHFPRSAMGFLKPRDYLPANRAILVCRVHEVEKIWRDGQRQLPVSQRRACTLLRSHGGQQTLKLVERRYSMLQLPLPIVPV